MRLLTLVITTLVLASSGCSERREPKPSPLALVASSCPQDAELGCPRPIFPVRDLRAGLRYYRDVLGFKVDWEYGEPPDFASVSRGEAILFLSQGGHGASGVWVMVFARDVDRLHDELRRRKALIKMPPTDMPWGTREMHVTDPDGNVIRFGSSTDH